MTKLSALKVAVIATDGFEDSELIEPVRALKEAGAQVEILSAAPHRTASIRVALGGQVSAQVQIPSARVRILSTQPGPIQAFCHHDKSITVDVDRALEEAQPDEYDALVLPGGALNADALRMEPKVQSFIRQIQKAGKPIAATCHALWILVSAKLVQGRRLTSDYTIQDDIRNAGGNWVDQEVVVDGNWVTSRQPSDISAFNREMLNLFSRLTTSVPR